MGQKPRLKQFRLKTKVWNQKAENQHVLLETGAFAGLTGGVIGLVLDPPGYPTVAFFAVSVLITAYHIFSEWLSLIVKARSSQAVKRLLDLQPETARVEHDGREVELPIEQVTIGDRVRVRPGEHVPADGEVVIGRSAVNPLLVTGEPIPVEKLEGDQVIGGSINGTGTLLVKVTAIGEESFLARIVREVEDARALKPGILHLVDRVLRVYTPVADSETRLSLPSVAIRWPSNKPDPIFGQQRRVLRAPWVPLNRRRTAQPLQG